MAYVGRFNLQRANGPGLVRIGLASPSLSSARWARPPTHPNRLCSQCGGRARRALVPLPLILCLNDRAGSPWDWPGLIFHEMGTHSSAISCGAPTAALEVEWGRALSQLALQGNERTRVVGPVNW